MPSKPTVSKAYTHTPGWVFRLMFPTDRIILESLSRDYLFDWMSNLTAGNPRDVFDMYFLAEDVKPFYEKWFTEMYHKKKCGSLWRRIRAIPYRWQWGTIPLW